MFCPSNVDSLPEFMSTNCPNWGAAAPAPRPVRLYSNIYSNIFYHVHPVAVIPHCKYFFFYYFLLSSCTWNVAQKSQWCKYTLTESHAPTMHVHTPSTANAFSGQNIEDWSWYYRSLFARVGLTGVAIKRAGSGFGSVDSSSNWSSSSE